MNNCRFFFLFRKCHRKFKTKNKKKASRFKNFVFRSLRSSPRTVKIDDAVKLHKFSFHLSNISLCRFVYFLMIFVALDRNREKDENLNSSRS
jgi:hypothetical protein